MELIFSYLRYILENFLQNLVQCGRLSMCYFFTFIICRGYAFIKRRDIKIKEVSLQVGKYELYKGMSYIKVLMVVNMMENHSLEKGNEKHAPAGWGRSPACCFFSSG